MIRSLMPRLFMTSAVAMIFLQLWAPPALAKNHSLSITTNGKIHGCDEIQIKFDDGSRSLAVAREVRVLPSLRRSEVERLVIEAPQGSGLIVETTAGGSFEATVCLAAGARRKEDAAELLTGVTVGWTADRLSVDGPESDDDSWVVYLFVKAPAGASLDLSAENGPIELRGLSGEIRARNQNGPTSAEDCSGEIALTSRNGPVSVTGGSGRLTVEVENGPISIALAGDRWQGEGIDAHAQNGPVSLTVPGHYASGVLVESSGHSPFSCDGSPCAGARRSWDDDRRTLRIGGAKTQIRVSTVNGPMSVVAGGGWSDSI